MTCIYALSHPITGEIRYIGKTVLILTKRMNAHRYHAKAGKSPVYCWIRKLVKQDLEPVTEIIEECDESRLDKLEILYIKYGREMYNLLNLTDGGDGGKTKGNTGMKHSEETKRKLSALRKGTKHSEDTKRKIGQSQKGISKPSWSKESKQNMSEYRKLNPTPRDSKTGRFVK